MNSIGNSWGQDLKVAASLPPLREGDKLGEYLIVSDTINAGGFGRIYKAYQPIDGGRLHKVVAIKEFYVSELVEASNSYFLSIGLSDFDREEYLAVMFQYFQQETLMQKLFRVGTNVPMLYGGVSKDNGRYYYVMEYVEGATLREIVEKEGVIPESGAMRIIMPVARLLHRAHRRDMTHGDVSPNNIMLRKTTPVLIDFGNARGYMNYIRREIGEARLKSAGANLFNPIYFSDEQRHFFVDLDGNVPLMDVGTGGFVAPIDIQGTPAGDVYSLAATLFYILTGCWWNSENIRENEAKLSEVGVNNSTINAIQKVLCCRSGTIRDFLYDLPANYLVDKFLRN